MPVPAKITFRLLELDDDKPAVSFHISHPHFKKRILKLKKSGIEWQKKSNMRGKHVPWAAMWELFKQEPPTDSLPKEAGILSLTVLKLDESNPVVIVNPVYTLRGKEQRQLGTLLIGEHGIKWRKWKYRVNPQSWNWQNFHDKVNKYQRVKD